jgi:hypothetical protein
MGLGLWCRDLWWLLSTVSRQLMHGLGLMLQIPFGDSCPLYPDSSCMGLGLCCRYLWWLLSAVSRQLMHGLGLMLQIPLVAFVHCIQTAHAWARTYAADSLVTLVRCIQTPHSVASDAVVGRVLPYHCAPWQAVWSSTDSVTVPSSPWLCLIVLLGFGLVKLSTFTEARETEHMP